MRPAATSEDTALKIENRQIALKLLGFAAVSFILLLMPLYMIRTVFSPAWRFACGPLYNGWLIFGPQLVLMFVTIISLRFIRTANKNNSAYRIYDLISKFKLLSVVLIICAILIYGYGFSAYWFATPDGLSVQRTWFIKPIKYQWSDVIERRISCKSARRGYYLSFELFFRDGFEIDIAETQQEDVAKNFIALTKLTSNIKTEVDSDTSSNCPHDILAFISKN